MARRTQIKLRQLLVITCAWLLVGLFIAVYDYLVLRADYSLGFSPTYSFKLSLAMNLGSALMGAMLGGSFMVFYINVKYQEKPYGYTILAVSTSFILIIMLIILMLGVVFIPIQTGRPLSDPVTKAALNNFLTDSSRIKNVMTWAVVVAFTQLMLQVNSKFGHGAFGNIIRGKYNTPKEEKRIFMFLDLNSSTAIAEQLGNETYHELLKDFFADITNPILDNRGEIHQYVGDEVVVVWSHSDGVEDSRCVRCFFDIKNHIEKNSARYIRRYGLVPTFKAGIHCGNVVAGEVGIIKRDITYSGDVLNTTSRIQSMCRKFNAEIIASANLVGELRLVDNYIARGLGSIKLQGKEKEILLSALTPRMQKTLV